MNPTNFILGVWAQPSFQYNTKDWSRIPMFPKWVARGVNVFSTNGVNPNTGGHDPLIYCKMAADAGAKAMLMPEADKFDPAKLIGVPGFGGFQQPDEPEGWNHLAKNPDGTYNMPATIKAYQDRYANYKKIAPNVPVYGNFTGNFVWARPHNVAPNPTDQNYKDWFGACDWLSFDQYITNQRKTVESCFPIWQQQLGTMKQLSGGKKPIFNYVETSDYDTTNAANGKGPTADEYRAEVWSSVILGFQGIIYFAHRVAGGFTDDATPQAIDTEMKKFAKEVATYDQFFMQPSVPLVLPTPFVGCTKTLNGETIKIILNLSNTAQTYESRLYQPYDCTVVKTGQTPTVPVPLTLESLNARLKLVEQKLGL